MRVTLEFQVRVEIDADGHAGAADALLDVVDELRDAVQSDPTDNALALLDAIERAAEEV